MQGGICICISDYCCFNFVIDELWVSLNEFKLGEFRTVLHTNEVLMVIAKENTYLYNVSKKAVTIPLTVDI